MAISPPVIGAFPTNTKNVGPVMYYLLPFIEQQNLWNLSLSGGIYNVGNNGVYANQIKIYLCPSDPSAPNPARCPNVFGNTGGWGLTSYAENALVFGTVSYSTPGNVLSAYASNLAGTSRIPATFTDGTSNTIIFSEKYTQCGNSASTYGCNQWSDRYDVPNRADIGYPVTGLAAYFQITPNPWQTACVFERPSSGHTGGIVAGIGDGSVRFVNQGMSPTTWWIAIVPNDGLPMPSDW